MQLFADLLLCLQKDAFGPLAVPPLDGQVVLLLLVVAFEHLGILVRLGLLLGQGFFLLAFANEMVVSELLLELTDGHLGRRI